MEEKRMKIRMVMKYIEVTLMLLSSGICAGVLIKIAPTKTEVERMNILIIMLISVGLLFMFMDNCIDYIFDKPRRRIREAKFKVIGWVNEEYLLTAEELYLQVLEDSKRDYNWIASAPELCRVCDNPEFPEKYAKKIKIMILNCFANFEKSGIPITQEGREAALHCYNTLPPEDEEVSMAKKRYLEAIMDFVIEYEMEKNGRHIGQSYKEVCSEWKKSHLNEFGYIVNLKEIKEYLYADLKKTIGKAEQEGKFKKDDEEYEKIRNEIFAMVANIKTKR